MKVKTLLLVLTMILGFSFVSAAYTSPGWSYGYDIGLARGDNAGKAENLAPLIQGRVQLELFHFLFARIGLGLTPLHATASSPKGYDTTTFYADYRFIYQPFKELRFSPYVYAGTGGSLDLSDSDADIIPHFPMGIGVSTKLKPGLKLELNAGYSLSNTDDLDGRIRADGDENSLTGNKQDGFFSLTAGLSHSSVVVQRVQPKPIVIEKPVPTPAPKPIVTPPPAPPVVVQKPVEAAPVDTDGDGLTDLDELSKYRTDPNNPDTDGEGLTDYAEVMQHKTNPLNPDTDGEGLNDYAEVMQHKTNPLNPDTDGDKLTDYAEVMQHKTNPLNPDTDGDKLEDGAEVMQHKTNPLVVDTDGDTLSDYAEVMEHKTNPLNPDTDGDKLKDNEELLTYKTDPLVKDTDKGSVDDGTEVNEKKDPLDPHDDVMELKAGAKFSLEGILFDTAKATIKPASEPILNQAYTALAANPGVKIIIIGHTDNVGSASSNQTLSFNRAESVKNWLVKKGIDAARIKTMGKGLTEPRATNATAEGRTLNRRIEFQVEE